MPRQARLDTPGTLHYVMIRGIEGRNIFIDGEDREDFLYKSIVCEGDPYLLELVCYIHLNPLRGWGFCAGDHAGGR